MSIDDLDIGKLAAVLLCSASLISTGIVMFGAYQNLGRMENQVAENEQQITELSAKLAELNNTEATTAEQIEVQLSSAASAGAEIARLQNEYARLDIVRDEDQFVENANLIGNYLEDKTQQTPWYSGNIPGLSYEWRFLSTYSFSGNNVDVAWVCESGNDELLAYVIASYSAADNLFSSLERHMTYEGASYIAAEGQYDADGNPVETGNTERSSWVLDMIEAYDESVSGESAESDAESTKDDTSEESTETESTDEDSTESENTEDDTSEESTDTESEGGVG